MSSTCAVSTATITHQICRWCETLSIRCARKPWSRLLLLRLPRRAPRLHSCPSRVFTRPIRWVNSSTSRSITSPPNGIISGLRSSNSPRIRFCTSTLLSSSSLSFLHLALLLLLLLLLLLPTLFLSLVPLDFINDNLALICAPFALFLDAALSQQLWPVFLATRRRS